MGLRLKDRKHMLDEVAMLGSGVNPFEGGETSSIAESEGWTIGHPDPGICEGEDASQGSLGEEKSGTSETRPTVGMFSAGRSNDHPGRPPPLLYHAPASPPKVRSI